MKPWIFLRAASVLALLYCAAHTAGAPWIPEKGAESMALISTMKSHAFQVQGASVTYWGFYLGFGVAISAFQLMGGVLLWQIASITRRGAGMDVRPMIATILLAYAANAVIAWRWFFVAPAVFAAAIVACLAISLGLVSREAGAS